MAAIIKWTKKAQRHLQEIEAYIEEVDCAEKARRTVSKIMDAPEKLRYSPELGSIVAGFEDKSFREIRAFKWRILYTLSKDKRTVRIQAVWHGARRLRKEDIGEIEH